VPFQPIEVTDPDKKVAISPGDKSPEGQRSESKKLIGSTTVNSGDIGTAEKIHILTDPRSDHQVSGNLTRSDDAIKQIKIERTTKRSSHKVSTKALRKKAKDHDQFAS